MLNNHYIIEVITGALFAAETRRLQKIVDEIHKKNQVLQKQMSEGYLYQGRPYIHSMYHGVRGACAKTTLHIELWHDKEAYLLDFNKVDTDRTLIKQVLFKLIEPCSYQGGNALQNARDSIPDCIIDTAPDEIKSLRRMGSGTMFHVHRDLRDYNKALPLMEYYSVTRLLY